MAAVPRWLVADSGSDTINNLHTFPAGLGTFCRVLFAVLGTVHPPPTFREKRSPQLSGSDSNIRIWLAEVLTAVYKSAGTASGCLRSHAHRAPQNAVCILFIHTPPPWPFLGQGHCRWKKLNARRNIYLPSLKKMRLNGNRSAARFISHANNRLLYKLEASGGLGNNQL